MSVPSILRVTEGNPSEYIDYHLSLFITTSPKASLTPTRPNVGKTKWAYAHYNCHVTSHSVVLYLPKNCMWQLYPKGCKFCRQYVSHYTMAVEFLFTRASKSVYYWLISSGGSILIFKASSIGCSLDECLFLNKRSLAIPECRTGSANVRQLVLLSFLQIRRGRPRADQGSAAYRVARGNSSVFNPQ